MAYDTSKLASLQALKDTATRIKKEYLAAISKAGHASFQKAESVPTAEEAQENILYFVKNTKTGFYDIYALVDGSVEWLDDTTVDLDGYVTDEALAAVLAGKADSATTLAGYGITDAYTKEELNAKISAVYKPAGSVAFADLPALAENVLGNVYNVTNAFTTTDSFVEGAGNKYPKGTNVVVVKSGEDYKFDVLAGFVDLSGKVDKEDGKGLSANDFTDELKAKLDAIAAGATKVEASETNGNIKINGTETQVYKEPTDVVHGAVATDDEVTEMLNEVFTTTGV